MAAMVTAPCEGWPTLTENSQNMIFRLQEDILGSIGESDAIIYGFVTRPTHHKRGRMS